MNKDLLKSKTLWAAVIGIVGAVGGYATGEMNIVQAIQTAGGCLLAIFLRDGIAKN